MASQSAGILLYRRTGDGVEVLLIHPGGPFWTKKDQGAWSIPKGEYGDDEAPDVAARRELAEETGLRLDASLMPLGDVRQTSGKRVTAFAAEGAFDPANLTSNLFEMEWPPKSGRRQSFPEVDRAQWFTPEEARLRLIPAQAELIDRLLERLR